MRHRKKGKILDRKIEVRKMMLKNLAASVIIYEKVKTTEAKAKAVKPLVEKLITISKKEGLNSRRNLIKLLPQKMAVKKIVEVLSKRFQDRKGGYTRTVKLGARQGDGAEMAQLELV